MKRSRDQGCACPPPNHSPSENQSSHGNPLISELQHLIVESLALEDVQPEDIDPDEPLFGEGLGLDSIDALELGLALKKRFGVTLTAESEESRAVFKNVRSLADYIESHREQA
ncbi:phosphopantetheine-binding protein [Sutterella wadsworthensis]|uniref:phosphopantetheine-binding protein n=2 Tax=Sutterella wadsworthensis TaxID=40545 RepID=UPI003AB935C9